jgi:hypothetical protein
MGHRALAVRGKAAKLLQGLAWRAGTASEFVVGRAAGLSPEELEKVVIVSSRGKAIDSYKGGYKALDLNLQQVRRSSNRRLSDQSSRLGPDRAPAPSVAAEPRVDAVHLGADAAVVRVDRRPADTLAGCVAGAAEIKLSTAKPTLSRLKTARAFGAYSAPPTTNTLDRLRAARRYRSESCGAHYDEGYRCSSSCAD